MRDWAEFLCIAVLPVAFGLVTLRFFEARVRGRARVGVGTLAAGNGLLLLTLASLVLLGFETQLRFFYDASDGDNRTRVSRRWFERHWVVNSFDLRDDIDYPLRRRLSRRRISFVGDSFTAGHGVPDVQARYVNLLRARHPDWEVHAFAIPGLETETEAQLLAKALGRGYELDVVVLAYYLENIGHYVPELVAYFERAARPLPQPLRFLVEHSFAVDTFVYRAQTRLQYGRGYWNDMYGTAYAGPAWEQQQIAFRRFRALVTDHGGSFAALTFPTLAGVEGRREILAKIDAFWAREGVPHLDLLPVFEPHPSRALVANPHDAHPGAFAQRLAADAIERFLLERVLPELPPR
jgi:hypothetical protein